MTTPTRIYKVTHGTKTRLVRASHPSVALRHVANDLISVEIATQDDLVKLLPEEGVRVETAGED